jgi:hypothetical protein
MSLPRYVAVLALLLAAAAPAAPATAAPATDTGPGATGFGPAPSVREPVDLSHGTGSNVRTGAGGLTLADPHHVQQLTGQVGYGAYFAAGQTLSQPVTEIRAVTDTTVPAGGGVDVDVAGRLASGQWTEWQPATATTPATLKEAVTEVQVRVTLRASPTGAAPAVRSVTLTGDQPAGPAAATPAATALTYTVFATREGLVGGTTANGHTIVSHDHFISLPSGRSLSAQNSGTYTVKVCYSGNGRCEWAPVWEVGPWNTRDDYWNPPSTRQMWTDLPQGRPEAQAAYQNGYNGGHDEFGRTVANPAGIDLADGVFQDGLALPDNSWVTASFLWTASGAVTGTIAASPYLNVRSGPHTASGVVGFAAHYARTVIECQTSGDSVSGTYGTSNLWERLGSGQYVARAYVSVTGTPATC